jgi:hypothetical protein
VLESGAHKVIGGASRDEERCPGDDDTAARRFAREARGDTWRQVGINSMRRDFLS